MRLVKHGTDNSDAHSEEASPALSARRPRPIASSRNYGSSSTGAGATGSASDAAQRMIATPITTSSLTVTDDMDASPELELVSGGGGDGGGRGGHSTWDAAASGAERGRGGGGGHSTSSTSAHARPGDSNAAVSRSVAHGWTTPTPATSSPRRTARRADSHTGSPIGAEWRAPANAGPSSSPDRAEPARARDHDRDREREREREREHDRDGDQHRERGHALGDREREQRRDTRASAAGTAPTTGGWNSSARGAGRSLGFDPSYRSIRAAGTRSARDDGSGPAHSTTGAPRAGGAADRGTNVRYSRGSSPKRAGSPHHGRRPGADVHGDDGKLDVSEGRGRGGTAGSGSRAIVSAPASEDFDLVGSGSGSASMSSSSRSEVADEVDEDLMGAGVAEHISGAAPPDSPDAVYLEGEATALGAAGEDELSARGSTGTDEGEAQRADYVPPEQRVFRSSLGQDFLDLFA